MENELRKLYYNAKTGYGSSAHLYRIARKKKVMVTMRQATDFVKKQEVSQLFATKNTKKEMRHFRIESQRGYWQVDHTFMKHKQINKGFSAIFVAINTGTRYVYAKAMKNIRSEAVTQTFNDFVKTVKKKNVRGIVSDKGSEFISSSTKDWMAQNGVTHRVLHPTYHYLANAIVERYNGVLKGKLYMYMAANKTKMWVDALDDVVYNHNHSVHKTTKHRPKDMLKSPLKEMIFRLKTVDHNNKLRADKKFVLSKINKGSKVRILRITDKPFAFKKQKYSKTVHTVDKLQNGGVLIKLKGKSRKVRPFEVLPVGETVEKNPFAKREKREKREKKSKGTTTRRRIRNDPLVREAEKAKDKAPVVDETGRGVKIDVNGKEVHARVKRMDDNGGLWVEYVYTDGKKYEQYVKKEDFGSIRFVRDVPDFDKIAMEMKSPMKKGDVATTVGRTFDYMGDTYEYLTVDYEKPKFYTTFAKAAATSNKDKEASKVVCEEKFEETVAHSKLLLFSKTIKTGRTIVVRTTAADEDEKFWLGKVKSDVRRANLTDVRKSGQEVGLKSLVVEIQWYNVQKNGSYTLPKGGHVLDLKYAVNVGEVKLKRTKSQYVLSAFSKKQIEKHI